MRRKLLKKHLLKCTSFLLMWLIVAHVFAQITISVQNRSLRETLREIERTSDYKFFYSETLPGLDETISIQLTDAGIETAMQQLLADTGIEYRKSGDVIALVEKQAQPPAATATTITQQATSRNVTGTIVDALTNETLIGATVWVKETARGTVTDLDGNFSVLVSNNSTVLVITYVGYDDLEVEVGNRTNLGTILLHPASEALQEFVVVAHGVQRRESVIGAISTINVGELRTPSSKISNVLAGRLSGVVALTRSGQPGEGTDFFIRGIATFGANSRPLVLIDGVERDLDSVDPEDIATFSILKDATATAVYGVRGANGVVLVTTRMGQEGRPRITVRAERGIAGPTQMPKMANSVQWAKMWNEASESNFYSPEALEAYRTGSDPDLFPNVNWIDELYKDFANNTRLNVNISGGASIARYYIAGSLYDEGSIFKTEQENVYNSSLRYRRINFRANFEVNVTPSTMVNVNLANIYETRRRPGSGIDNIWDYTFNTSPNAFPMRYSNGLFAGPSSGDNPYNALMQSGYANDYWNQAQSLVGLSQDLSDLVTPGLRANIRFSWDARNNGTITRSMTVQQWLATGRNEDGELEFVESHRGQENLGYERSLNGRRDTYLEASVSYDKLFAQRHRVGALFLYNQKQRNLLNEDNALRSLPFRNQGIAGRVTYGLDDKYFAEFNAGYNGSENFMRGHRFGFFPAGAVGYMVSNEDYWDPIRDVVDVFKLKASYGLVGNDQIGTTEMRRFIYEATIISEGNNYIFGQQGETRPGRIRMGDPENPYVSWENAYKFNVGAEVSLFNALRIEGDYFRDRREGIFLERQGLAGLVGITTVPYVNVGRMTSQGFDGSMQYNQRVGSVNLSAMGTFTYTHTEILDNDQPDWNYPYRNRIGRPHGQPWGLVALGLFESEEDIANSPRQTFGPVRPGDIKYLDINGDGVIDEQDEIAIGYNLNHPGITYGFGLSGQYKGFDVSTFFQGVGQISIWATGSALTPFSSGNLVRSAIYEDVYHNRWSLDNPNPNAKYPRLSPGANPNNNRNSTFRMHDASFLRLKTAEIGYTLPRNLVEPLHISSLRVFMTGTNLLTFSSFRLWDPERGTNIGNRYPPNRSVVFGLNVNF
ncbi:MAG: TonB-dependent receptor [Dysgonamonadaceae bacterium]|jgi:TonB-linked SusC/RagA family outer membrane protein|nr:TonB-dependent receptor [Dysgonamonadaceae bacterium]